MKRQILISLILLSSVWTMNAQTLYIPNGSIGIGNNTLNSNVGIGISSPTTTLHLKSDANTYIRFDKLSTNQEAGLVFGINGSSDFYLWTDNGNNSLKIEASGLNGESDETPRVEFPFTNKNILLGLSGGKVGIGLNSPSATLDILGVSGSEGDRNFRVQYRDGGYLTNTEFSALSHIPTLAGGNGWTALYAKQGSASKAGVFEGDVLIYGNLKTKEVKVTINDFPDFVFENDYKLMPLNELEKFVKKQKHLPEIAPAKEMEANGADLGNLNSKLLQKMEEMTLYMIEQNKKIQALEAKIEKLESASK
jgi:hypothetical protein